MSRPPSDFGTLKLPVKRVKENRHAYTGKRAYKRSAQPGCRNHVVEESPAILNEVHKQNYCHQARPRQGQTRSTLEAHGREVWRCQKPLARAW